MNEKLYPSNFTDAECQQIQPQFYLDNRSGSSEFKADRIRKIKESRSLILAGSAIAHQQTTLAPA